MLDAALEVPRPLGHLPPHMGKPSLTGLHPESFGSQTSFDESGCDCLVASMGESVSGCACKENGRLIDLVGAGPSHDLLVPITGFRASVPVVEQEQRDSQVRCQLQIRSEERRVGKECRSRW